MECIETSSLVRVRIGLWRPRPASPCPSPRLPEWASIGPRPGRRRSNAASEESVAAREGILAVCGKQMAAGGSAAGEAAGGVSEEQQRAQHDVIGSTWLQMRGFDYKVATNTTNRSLPSV